MKLYKLGSIQFWVTLILLSQLSACGQGRGNRTPTAQSLSVTASEDTAQAITLSGRDTDGRITEYTVTSNPSNGSLTGNAPYLTYTPNSEFSGSDNFTYRVTDNAGARSSNAVVNITVDPVNDAPIAASDSYSASGNTQKVVSAPGVLANDSDMESAPTSLSITAGSITTDGGGSVDMNADGSFTYNPPVEASSDSFSYTLNDNDATDPLTASGTVTVSFGPTIWYVDDSAVSGGNGTYATPFNALADAIAAASSGDTLFVYAGNYTGGVTLSASVQLIGEGEGLSVDGLTIPPGSAPVITADASTDLITLANDNTLKGISLSGGRNGIVADSITDLTIQNVSISDTAADSISLANIVGTVNITDGSISNVSNGADGLAILNASLPSGSLTLNIDNMQLDGNGASSGMHDAIDIYSGTNATLIATITNNAINNTYIDGIEVDVLGTSGSDTVTLGTTLNGNTFSGVGGKPMNLVAADNANVQFHIHDNQMDGNSLSTSHGIDLRVNDNCTVTANIINNTLTDIGNDAPADNGLHVQLGNTATASSTMHLVVQNNTITNNTGTGLRIHVLGDSDALLTATGNTIGSNGLSEGVRISSATANTQVCLTMDSNSFTNSDVTYVDEPSDGSMIRIPAAANVSAFSANNGNVTVNTTGAVGFAESCTIVP